MKKRLALVGVALVVSLWVTTGGVFHFESDVYQFSNVVLDADAQLYFGFAQGSRDTGLPFIYSHRRCYSSNRADLTFIDTSKDHYKTVEFESITVESVDGACEKVNEQVFGGEVRVDGGGLIRVNQSDPAIKPRSYSHSVSVDLGKLGRVKRVVVSGWAEDKAGLRREFSVAFLAVSNPISELTPTWCAVARL